MAGSREPASDVEPVHLSANIIPSSTATPWTSFHQRYRVDSKAVGSIDHLIVLDQTIAEPPAPQLDIRRFPPEIREMIYYFATERDFYCPLPENHDTEVVCMKLNQTPPIIKALRPDKELYYEALRVFYRNATFDIHRFNGWSFGETSGTALRTIRSLCILPSVPADFSTGAGPSAMRARAVSHFTHNIDGLRRQQDDGLRRQHDPPLYLCLAAMSRTPNITVLDLHLTTKMLKLLTIPHLSFAFYLEAFQSLQKLIIEFPPSQLWSKRWHKGKGLPLLIDYANTVLGVNAKLYRVEVFDERNLEGKRHSRELASREWFWEAPRGCVLGRGTVDMPGAAAEFHAP
ncbi:hypothetical protein BP6252_01570 [Coleophoma cylindrospora]|uniref:F-box domain-containing protein n=1 Tax=Coleophoma cylindrospora TaxID=1849047 RepID=A0A3D8SUS6_9HELO|nr:hypothetical protein BP6252_01570 [Coleophoma cylindrospora]